MAGAPRRRHVSKEPRGETSRTMETLSPELIASLTITSGLGFVMVWIATRKGMIEERDSGKRCPSCGLRARADGSCACSGQPH